MQARGLGREAIAARAEDSERELPWDFGSSSFWLFSAGLQPIYWRGGWMMLNRNGARECPSVSTTHRRGLL
jgi:hypothetical protein